MTKKSKVTIFTDGACSGNPGPGGWGVLLKSQGKEKQLCGGSPDTTNNKMELTAAIEALNHLKWPCEVDLHTDSKYVRDGITSWSLKWKKNNWENPPGKPIKNRDFWIRLDEAASRHTIRWHWVKGHAGNPGNELADELARKGMEPFLKPQASP